VFFLGRIVGSEVQRVDFQRVHQLRDQLIALNQVGFHALSIVAKRVVFSARAITAMHMAGRILPCIAESESEKVVHMGLISSAVLQRRKLRKDRRTRKVLPATRGRELLLELQYALKTHFLKLERRLNKLVNRASVGIRRKEAKIPKFGCIQGLQALSYGVKIFSSHSEGAKCYSDFIKLGDSACLLTQPN